MENREADLSKSGDAQVANAESAQSRFLNEVQDNSTAIIAAMENTSSGGTNSLPGLEITGSGSHNMGEMKRPGESGAAKVEGPAGTPGEAGGAKTEGPPGKPGESGGSQIEGPAGKPAEIGQAKDCLPKQPGGPKLPGEEGHDQTTKNPKRPGDTGHQPIPTEPKHPGNPGHPPIPGEHKRPRS